MDVAVKGTNPALPVNTEKAKALAAALAQIEKQFGKGTIMRLGEGEVIEDIQVVSTGSLGLDIALGVGGLPRGRVVEFMARNRRARPLSRCRWWPRCKSKAAPARLSMPSTPSTCNTPRSWACSCPTC